MRRPTAADRRADPPPSALRNDAPGVTTALDRLTKLHPKKIDLSLGRMQRLLAALGHPERRIPPVVHVAGTNGKGSVVAIARAVLEASGRRVHAYTSPHLVRFAERIVLAGSMIDDERLADLLNRCETANGDAPITFFEITTAAALLGFAETPADVTLLEVGLGGRLDATNVVDRPLVSVITRISRDHTQFLGDTIAEIAGEKAGILKPAVPAVVGPQGHPDAVAVLTDRAAQVGAPMHLHGRDWQVRSADGAMVVARDGAERRWPVPRLPGDHQVGNAATALLALETAGLPVGEADIGTGLASVAWPARLQPLGSGRHARLLPAGWDLWLDGGHNDSAGEVLAAWAAGDDRPLHLVVGMLANKRPAEFLSPLAPLTASLVAVPIPGESAWPPDELAAAARACGIAEASTGMDVPSALRGLASRPGRGRVVICGSLYLAGQVLAADRPAG